MSNSNRNRLRIGFAFIHLILVFLLLFFVLFFSGNLSFLSQKYFALCYQSCIPSELSGITFSKINRFTLMKYHSVTTGLTVDSSFTCSTHRKRFHQFFFSIKVRSIIFQNYNFICESITSYVFLCCYFFDLLC